MSNPQRGGMRGLHFVQNAGQRGAVPRPTADRIQSGVVNIEMNYFGGRRWGGELADGGSVIVEPIFQGIQKAGSVGDDHQQCDEDADGGAADEEAAVMTGHRGSNGDEHNIAGARCHL
jgi:hypothetical protein